MRNVSTNHINLVPMSTLVPERFYLTLGDLAWFRVLGGSPPAGMMGVSVSEKSETFRVSVSEKVSVWDRYFFVYILHQKSIVWRNLLNNIYLTRLPCNINLTGYRTNGFYATVLQYWNEYRSVVEWVTANISKHIASSIIWELGFWPHKTREKQGDFVKRVNNYRKLIYIYYGSFGTMGMSGPLKGRISAKCRHISCAI